MNVGRRRQWTHCRVLILVAVLAAGVTAQAKTWNGAGANTLASNPANWVGGAAPVGGDPIVLDTTTNKNMEWDLTNVTVSSWSQVGYNGIVTIDTVYSGTFTQLQITGDCVISTGTWTHQANTTV